MYRVIFFSLIIANIVGCKEETQTVTTSPVTTPVTTPVTVPIKQACIDGQYTEPLPDTSKNIDDLVVSYKPENAAAFIDQVLARRYPLGQQLVTEGVASRHDCIAQYLRDKSSAKAVLNQLSLVVHECGHAADGERSTFDEDTYIIKPSLVMAAKSGDTTTRGGLTFARGKILADGYQAMRVPCGNNDSSPACDFYAHTYLDGFSGEQGFNTLFEELVQYTNSLATDLAISDKLQDRQITDRDGLLTFLWYVERYLHLARTNYPSAYQHLLTGDDGRWRRVILTQWGRAWYFLKAAETNPYLGLYDNAIMPLVKAPELLDEIQRLRDAEDGQCSLK